MRGLLSCALAVFFVVPVQAQNPIVPDSTKHDSTGVLLPEITVTVTRDAEPLSRVPAAVSVLDRDAIHRGQGTIGLDEALSNIPGVFVTNRYNFSLDQRLSIRGFGSRSNFGLRGVKVLLDGIPQTLPDGQSQLTNLDLGDISRVEVLRRSSSALYGNASSGVLSFFSQPAGPEPLGETVRAEAGSAGRYKLQSRTSGRSGAASGTLSLSHTNSDGFRQNSAAEFTQLSLGADYALSSATTAILRFGYTDAPEAKNPGALTEDELFANSDSAAANNIRRKADKDVSQGQLGLTLRHRTRRGEFNMTVSRGTTQSGQPTRRPAADWSRSYGRHLRGDRSPGGRGQALYYSATWRRSQIPQIDCWS